MAASEKERYQLGCSSRFYEESLLEQAHAKKKDDLLRGRQVVKAQDMAWENSRHGRLKHILNDKMDYPEVGIDMYMMVLPPRGCSGKHRHMAEELIYVLEGKGYDMHWDPEVEITDKYYFKIKPQGVKYDWDTGDFVYIPPMVAHQHFNSSKAKQVRFLAATNRAYKRMGFPELEQLEDAPDYKPQA